MSIDWALVEIDFPPITRPPENFGFRFEFSAYIEAPFDALAGVEPDQELPVQGVAKSSSSIAGYPESSILAFPNISADAALAVVPDSDKFFSLLVDLNSFAADAVIRIGLYGQLPGATVVGGVGIDEGQVGTLVSSTFYGSVTKDYRSLDDVEWTPGNLAACPDKFFLKSTFVLPADFDVLVTSFPSLASMPHEKLGLGTGDFSVGTSFTAASVFSPSPWINEDLGTSWGDVLFTRPSSVAPDDDPNQWGLFDYNFDWNGTDASITTTVNWGPGVIKTKTINCSLFQYTHGDIVELVDEVPLEVDAGSHCSTANRYQIQYYVPTWNYPNIFEGQVKGLCIEGVNLWDAYATRNATYFPSRSWEDSGIYPDRVELGDLGTAVIDSTETPVPPEINIFPADHFDHMRLGTITIIRSTGEMTFMPTEIPPTDGTPDGDGAIGDGTAPGRTDNPHLRVWTFSLDEHDYYVLRLGDFDEIIWDAYSEQWMDWNDFDSLTWRAQCGRNWIGAEALGDTYGSNVIAGDDTLGLLWFLDPEQPFDDNPLGADAPSYFSRVTVGQVPMRGRENLPCYAAWLTTDMGDPAYSGAAVTLWLSDDAGVTWESQGSVVVTADENRPELAWYSLGQIEAPGRLFKIFDDGAITRIDGLEMNDPDDK